MQNVETFNNSPKLTPKTGRKMNNNNNKPEFSTVFQLININLCTTETIPEFLNAMRQKT